MKKEKIEKRFAAKKLPALFKKKYAKKKFEKKISSKLYIDSDKVYVVSLFTEEKDKKGRDVLAVSKDLTFTKKELKRLKNLSKEIKANRSRIKLASFIAVAVVLGAIGITVTIFKNPVAKFAIKSGMQGIFGAKCDIASVNVEIFGARLTVKNLAQASAEDEMKNLFQFNKLDLDFNLTQLLRARFDAQNIEITGIALNTDRTKSGKLSAKKASLEKKAKKNDDTKFYDSLKAKMGSNPDEAKNAIADLFASYDPNAITEKIKDGLQSQKVAKEVEEELKVLVEKWKSKPEELKAEVSKVQESVKTLTSINVSNVNVTEIPALLKQIEQATTTVKNAKTNLDSSISSFESDSSRVSLLQKKLNDAISSDKDLLSSQLSILDVGKAKNALSETIERSGYAMLGKYYPYLKQLISYASNMKSSPANEKSSKADKKSVKKAKEADKRYAGRTVYWKKDNIPSFLIEKAHGSGSGIDFFATNISNDMNKRGEPWVIKGTVERQNLLHKANLVVDARSQTKNPLVFADYSGSNFPLTIDLAKNVSVSGAPKFEGNSNLSAKLTASSDFGFSGGASIFMNPANVSSLSLDSELANRIYSTALASIKSVEAKADFSFSEKNGIGLKIASNFEDLLSNAISSVANKELANVKEQAISKLNEKLGSSEAVNQYISQLSQISTGIKDSNSAFDVVTKQLESKKVELNKKLADSARGKASSAAAEAASSFKNKLKF
ncbi:TIGR03545 family protein [Treponema pectinovorum]|uniref:TIGR03545 family protein n=1 Tax=Treponema pectinovorum TaxID=164 RepID=UPI0011CB0F96|nr:TIGR03545 family protein [Treponema pectinovorum]